MSKALADLAATVSNTQALIPEKIASKPTLQSPATSSRAEKLKTLKALEATLNKQFGVTTSIVRLGNKVGTLMPSLSGDLYTVDFGLIGTGGIPRGRIIEIYGPESGGKTTFCLNYVAKEQQRGELVAYVDAEHALDPNYMKQLGVDVDELLVSQPDSGEQALETVEALIESRTVRLIIVDSVAALVPQAELDGEMGDSHMGLQARMMSQAMRKLRGKCAINDVTVIFINQIREKIGVMFGSPETTTGGRALKFYASVRLDVRRTGGTEGLIKSGDVVIGHKMKIKGVKNKVGSPARETIVDVIYGKGIDTFSDFVTYAIGLGVISKGGGGWMTFGEDRLGQGTTNVVSALRDNPELMDKIKAEVAKAQAAQREADAS
jgi:recombination protein RecA